MAASRLNESCSNLCQSGCLRKCKTMQVKEARAGCRRHLGIFILLALVSTPLSDAKPAQQCLGLLQTQTSCGKPRPTVCRRGNERASRAAKQTSPMSHLHADIYFQLTCPLLTAGSGNVDFAACAALECCFNASAISRCFFPASMEAVALDELVKQRKAASIAASAGGLLTGSAATGRPIYYAVWPAVLHGSGLDQKA